MATIKQIARQTGVSPSTVSIVLRGNARERHISEATEQLVLRTAAELGYQPNLAARRLRDGERSPIFIALYMADDFRTPMMLRFLTGLRDKMQEYQDCELVIRLYEPGHLTESTGPEVLRLFHAAIVCNATASDLQALEAAPPRIPVVLYNRSSPGFPSVEMDHASIGQQMAHVFAAHGRKSAVWLASEAPYAYQRQRRDAFLQEAQRLGMEATVLSQPDSMYHGSLAARYLLEEGLPDCIAAASDQLAIGALHSLRGVAIPETLELISVGNGDRQLQQFTQPSLSVIELPMEDMARRCFAMLMRCLAGETPASEIMPVRFVGRETTLGGNNHG